MHPQEQIEGWKGPVADPAAWPKMLDELEADFAARVAKEQPAQK
jgi:hypothetical protein